MSDHFGLYIHVPFCATRCGYCDFNTYTPQELQVGEHSANAGNTIDGYLDALERELEVAARVWDRHESDDASSETARINGVSTVFFGGGTPSMLGHEGLTRALRAVKRTVGLAPDAEVTTESNPESTSPEFFHALRAEGFTRISLGMQSVAGHVLKVLDRRHTPGRPVAAAQEAREAGFEHVNLDLIYGTPTETDADLRASLEAVLSAGVDHVSAYSLIVEDGTALARKVRKGQLPAPDEDVLADRYAMIDSFLKDAGMDWYEVSNWARPGGECRHNLLYWNSGQWWGAGPGAHGCVQLKEHPGVTRLVNAKRPATYWDGLLGARTSSQHQDFLMLPGSVSHVEELSPKDLATERVMLGLRLREGIPVEVVAQGGAHGDARAGSPQAGSPAPLSPAVEEAIAKYQDLGLLWRNDARLGVTDQGKYLADGIVTDLLLAMDDEV
ncbi:coproporphyrinogen III oxidase [Corynebacterium sp. 320]|uniref:radical SAM family heme chaperone HemW n=1 Tax=Corynebacterium TaxID=1716 RepID=UPI00125CC16B|nr:MULTISPECIES: radical SAM family heme chaperone HemW [Corynebacterium]KAB1502411.1 coproporphyrinogen III oxidase [Corynebacterium sp. 320]KAB1551368.1 coproporphyrinogen III oxidase [Corynebacterium sp. 321]KAB1551803.1 coproporphyrinogen III oxidase [Corynebacterium sp. 319]KAB3526018.1 coproporphyrinogen III oxidase [Corynebacterium sp. 250]KAB3538798.1 coproporphyrinogen III oxidase [Corynebacterium sp. 366]